MRVYKWRNEYIYIYMRACKTKEETIAKYNIVASQAEKKRDRWFCGVLLVPDLLSIGDNDWNVRDSGYMAVE